MQTFMLGLDRWLSRHRRVVLGTWIGLVVLAAPFAMHQGDHLTGGGYAIPGSDSLAVANDLRTFPGAQQAHLVAVLVPRPNATSADARAAIQRVASAAGQVSNVSLDPAAERQALAAVSAPGGMARTTIVPLRVTVPEEDSIDVAAGLRAKLALHNAPAGQPIGLHLVGQGALWAGLQDLSKDDLAKAEGTGFPIIALILIAVFGSLVAATLPLLLGLVSVLLTGAVIYALSLVTDMSVFVTNMASMIGIGVAVDYSLFVLARYRQEVRAGATLAAARATALATSGVAVTFSGLTVMISLAGLYLVQATAIRSMALGAIVVVAVSMLASATLLPLLITLLGQRVTKPGRIFALLTRTGHRLRARLSSATDAERAARPGFWARWTAVITKRPALAALLAVAVLVTLATPARNLHTVDGGLRQFPAANETRQGFEAAAKVTGPGASVPLEVLAPVAVADRARAVLSADPEVLSVAPTTPAPDGHAVLLLATPRHDGESSQLQAAIVRLRAQMPAGALVGGSSAGIKDFHTEVNGSMWKVTLFVLGMSFLVLLVLLRSIVLPLKAVAMNLLSVGAAYGVMTLVFGSVDTITPPLVLAVVFGLSMDYEVFLLSRIRERYMATGDTRSAVAQGLASSAGTISSAALIMVCVFTLFATTGVPSIQQLGLGCAVAIAVDATLVRLVLVPAAMELFGKWNWWLPTRLARVLPKTSIESLGQGAQVALAGTD
ncbi:MAG TPA: MMPL family transporter [Solirubrobacteraceae bacterium]|nr:MMPL family transporter [Solirubrobacteraceae bacterium]